MKKMGVTVEFNLTSNVKLNNITDIKKSPLKTYLQYGIPVVFGTDGGGIYGTNPREEQEVAMSYIGLTDREIQRIVKIENSFMMLDQKRERLRQDPERVRKKDERIRQFKYAENIAENKALPQEKSKTAKEFANTKKEKEIPEGKIPIIIAGGSFNQDGKDNAVSAKDIKRLKKIIQLAEPEKYCFVIGHSTQGQEGKLLELLKYSDKKFDVTSIVPDHLDEKQENKMKDSIITRIIEVSNDRGAGIYKGFDRTIFSKNRKALLYAFEGDAPLSNLIIEGNKDSNLKIRYNAKEQTLAEKAEALGIKRRDDRATMKPFNISKDVSVFGKDGKVAQLRNEAKEFGGKLFERVQTTVKELLEGMGSR